MNPVAKPCGLFVTGTDTGVGKTIVTTALTCALQSQGAKTGAMKPIETGAAGDGVSDSEWLRAVTHTDAAPDLTTPYRFRTSAAPLIAAEIERVTIDPHRIVSAFESLATHVDCLVVEGIGGVMVPLTPQLRLVDLIGRMHLPVLIVARAGLGSINHSLLTVEGLRGRGVPILGFVFNNPTPSVSPETHRTIPTILRLTGLRSFGELPHCPGLPQSWPQHQKRLIAALDVEGLMEALGLRGVA